MKLYQEYIIRDNAIEAKKHIKEINASLERLREYIEELKAKSINELITLYSEGKEKGKSFEEIIKDAKKGIAEDKKKIADIQKTVIDLKEFVGVSIDRLQLEFKARKLYIKEREARIKEFQTKLEIYYALKANKLRN